MKKNKKTRNIRYGRILDLVNIILFPILSILLVLFIHKYSDKYYLYAIGLFAFVFVVILLLFKIKGKMIENIRRVFLLLMVILLGLANFYTKDITSGYEAFASSMDNSETTIHYDVLTLKESTNNLQTLEDLDGYVIGFPTNGSAEATDKAKETLSSKLSDYGSLNYDNYMTMYSDYTQEYVDAIVVDQSQKTNLPEDYRNLYEISNVVDTYSFTIKNNIKGNDIDITKEVFTVLVSASDQIEAPTSHSLSDTNMILIIDPVNHIIQTISIPRDSFIPNPAYGNVSDKLTHTGNDGVENTKVAIEKAFDIKIDFYVKISFSSLIEIVDTLDGIPVNVLQPIVEQDEYRSFAEEDLIYLDAGQQTLNGKQALAYARHRHSYENQDLGRNQAQIEVMKGLVKRVLSPDGITKVDDVMKLMSNYVIMNFSESQLTSFVKQQVDNMPSWEFKSLSLDKGMQGSEPTASMPSVYSSIYYLSKSDIEKVNAMYHLMKERNRLSEFHFDLDDMYNGYSTYEESNDIVLAP
ncbi:MULTISPECIES: LCP family protein [unclassified Breznakia]|uniref:LCP family protein n=1 Tax=unclassified Breznakia TaxID=2623764 RepID=UPI002476C28A|nr:MULTISPECIES: LCP family protein [unclassified Breznakia]MDH6366428.1 LCP family protein required for cell wall assembly [Breznakia sp. PH1-1]MDH6403521.1 LCP family protein required for cell wall assembly [Breznakia sp. PF1-11]MDH6411230.1 LCP family protein required for cell wall assembly [Breznakia sp. PFB1-11]MDH6413507.1 LCP family protein required for cell wall assembly [Breznakia sp. PFB1-14]MDH6415775.1 LCP family protein required for cell wall assembly [Breznakia sp. PFB1-4]